MSERKVLSAAPWAKSSRTLPSAPWAATEPTEMPIPSLTSPTGFVQPSDVDRLTEDIETEEDQGFGRLERALDAIGGAVSGVYDAPYELVGGIVDIANMLPMAANILPGEQGIGPISDRPMLGSDRIDDFREAFSDVTGVQTYDPQTALGEAARRATSLSLQNIIPGVAAVKVGQRTPTSAVADMMATPNRTNVLGGALEPLNNRVVDTVASVPDYLRRAQGRALDSAQRTPSDLIRTESAFGTAAGVGQAAGEQVAPESSLAPLLGGVAGTTALGVTRAVGEPLVNTIRALRNSEGYGDEVVRSAVADDILANSSILRDVEVPEGGSVDAQPLIDALRDEPTRLEELAPGFVDTTASKTRDRGLADLTGMQASRSAVFSDRAAQNAEALDRAFEVRAPQQNPGAFTERAEDVRNQLLLESEERVSAAQQRFNEAVGRLDVPSTQEERGRDTRGIRTSPRCGHRGGARSMGQRDRIGEQTPNI